MWNDKENFKALMRAMGYKKYHDHMKFLKKRKIWDELVITRGKLCVPHRMKKSIFWAEIVFPHGLKSIYINKELKW